MIRTFGKKVIAPKTVFLFNPDPWTMHLRQFLLLDLVLKSVFEKNLRDEGIVVV